MSFKLFRVALLTLLVSGEVLASAGPETAEVPTPAPLVNLNAASVDELCTLPGIGRKKAEAIVALRSRRALKRVTQLLQVKGIGPRTLQRLKPLLTVAPAPSDHAVEQALVK